MFEVLVLSVLQGVAEFLPISSSGHLVLGRSLLGLGDVGMRLDICLHVGTLLSVFVFYFSVVARMKIRCSGGSSRILSSALKAEVESMWTSSMM